MGGPGTGSLLSAIAGAGASTAGALTRRPGAGQPLVALSQNLADQDFQQQRLAQDQQQQALQLKRQEMQDARQNFYIQQAVKTGAREDARDVRNIENQNIMQTLRQEGRDMANRGEARTIEAGTKKDQKDANAAALKVDPLRNVRIGIKDGTLSNAQMVMDRIHQTIPKNNQESAINEFVQNPDYSTLWLGGKTLKIPTPASGQTPVYNFNPTDRTIIIPK